MPHKNIPLTTAQEAIALIKQDGMVVGLGKRLVIFLSDPVC